ncbi:hypothetical protein R3P38DRAFT_3167011 [Favolaschia claudopus]|uniref:Uncharacterized protein n=1 Tax=Favolaschia claudopus TaxID=2862362 RepID=A0AAW0EA16_9AGAR
MPPASAQARPFATAAAVVVVEDGYLYLRWRGNVKLNILITAPPPSSSNPNVGLLPRTHLWARSTRLEGSAVILEVL